MLKWVCHSLWLRELNTYISVLVTMTFVDWGNHWLEDTGTLLWLFVGATTWRTTMCLMGKFNQSHQVLNSIVACFLTIGLCSVGGMSLCYLWQKNWKILVYAAASGYFWDSLCCFLSWHYVYNCFFVCSLQANKLSVFRAKGEETKRELFKPKGSEMQHLVGLGGLQS